MAVFFFLRLRFFFVRALKGRLFCGCARLPARSRRENTVGSGLVVYTDDAFVIVSVRVSSTALLGDGGGNTILVG